MAIYTGASKGKLFVGDNKVKKVYLGSGKVYSAGNIVTYIVDTNVSYQEEIDEGDSTLKPISFTPSKAGWTFQGWRTDKTASSPLSSMIMGENPITLYAVFTQTITLSYNGNGNTGGGVAAQTGTRYYNNGNYNNPTLALRGNGFSRTECVFKKWALGSVGGAQYVVGASITISANTTMYAVWSGVDKEIIGTIINNTNYFKDNGSLPDYTYAKWTNYSIDCSLYKAVQIYVRQAFANTSHEMTGVRMGIYETGGNFMPICAGSREAGSVGGAQHSWNFVPNGTTGTLTLKNTNGLINLYVGYDGVTPMGTAGRFYGSSFLWVESVKLIGR